MKFYIRLLLIFCCLGSLQEGFAQFYQGSFNEFGKNRVQYRDFLWKQYRFKEFDTYYYEGGDNLAAFTSKVAQQSIAELEDTFDFTIDDKIQFVVYNTQSDFKQSNVGITGDEQTSIGGITRIVGSKVFLYFEGDYMALERQIRDGLARVLVNSVLYGGNWREVVKSSTLLNLPEWYIEGLILYASKNVYPDTESRIRDGIMTGAYSKFNRLEGRESHIAGYALWRYVANTYGENIIPNILYMSRVSRNVESGFLFVLGKSLDSITKECIAYYHGEYVVAELSKEPIELEELRLKSKKGAVYTHFEVSPDGRYASYSNNVMGQYRLYIYDIMAKKRKKLLKAEQRLNRITDYSFPIMAWHPSSGAFSYVQEKRGKLLLSSYNVDDKKTTTREILQMDKILSMAYSPNGQQIAFSGVRNGQSDIYLYYNIGNRQEQLTNDLYGDYEPSFSRDGERIIFTSDRFDDTLRTKEFPTVYSTNRDVFAIKVGSNGRVLERITNTPDLIEREPYEYDSIRYTFLADFEGNRNRYLATYDSLISRIDTTIHYRYFTTAVPLSNYAYDLLEYAAYPKTGRFSTMTFSNKRYHFYTSRFNEDELDPTRRKVGTGSPSDPNGPRKPSKSIDQNTLIEDVETVVVPDDKARGEINIQNYQFEGERNFDYSKETITITELVEETTKAEQLRAKDGYTALDTIPLPGARNYNLNFTTDYIITQIDNTFLTNFYQPLSGPDNLNPSLSGLFKLGTSDLFEDYKIVGGMQLAGNLDNNTYMVSFEDLSKRLDKRFQLYRQSQRFNAINEIRKTITYSSAYRLSWPINEVFSLRGSALYRHDRETPLATDQRTAGVGIVSDHYVGLKGEIVFDNTLPMGLNLRRGMRFKFWGEYFKDPVDFKTDFITLGVDFRHYQRLHRKLIWANRFGYSASIGQENVAFFLGGVDDWWFSRTDNSLPLDPDQNYRFQTRGSPMRGFFANARNGTSMAVINSELRWPVFSYFFNKPLKSDFLENFQIIGFGDIGSAWTGLHPYSENNAFNSRVLETGNLTIEIKNNRDPVVYGYGFGLRSRILGYFMRFDWAWGVDDGVVLDRVFYFSLALDF